MKPTTSLLLILISIISLSKKINTFDVSKLKISSTTDQIMIVTGKYDTSYANFYYYIKNSNGNWEEYLKTEAHIGKNGLGKTKEGDYKTPIGKFKFTRYFGVAENPGTNVPYIKLDDSMYWDCDSKSTRYNQMVYTDYYNDFDKSVSEHLITETVAYKYAMNINYNEEGVPYKGSAIFLHCFTKNPYTAGCVALNEESMINVYKKINENCVIIIDSEENISNY